MSAEDILKRHKLKNTGCRKFIISELLKNQTALSEHEIKIALPDLFDRVTFYRSLKTLEEKNILHRVVLQDTTIKYALNKTSLDIHDHAHFHCTNCDGVICVEETIDQPVHLPNGYSVHSAQVLLEGVCSNCSEIDC